MRRCLTVLAIVGAMLPLSATAKTIGVSIPSNGDAFRTLIVNGLKKHAIELSGVALKLEDPGKDDAAQTAQVKQFVADHVDGIVVTVVNSDIGTALSRIAAEAKIPLVFVNAEPVNIDLLPPSQVFVGSDETVSGTLEAQEVCRLLGGKGRVVVMMGELFDYAARQRTQDVTNVFATDACRGLTIVERQEANWVRPDGSALMAEWLQAGVQFDAVVANNDEMALGAIQAMKTAGLAPEKIVVAGVDSTHDALEAMMSGDLKVTVFQNAMGQGAGAVDAVLKLVAGQNVDTRVYVPFELVTPETRESFASRN